MQANASSFSLHPLRLASTISYLALDQHCFISRPSSFVFIAFYITNTLLILPLIILILHPAVKTWLQNGSTTLTSTLNHFDCFTYHLVIMEIFGALRGILYLFGVYKENVTLLFIGGLLSCFIWYGETFFHVLTCVERYLAVVHPIIYLGLRSIRGVRIRNVSAGCVWLLCVVRMGLLISEGIVIIIDFCLLVLLISVILFCSLSVLWVLIHPSPGKQERESIDQSKKRAFYTILTILGVLIFRFVGSLTWNVLYVSQGNECLIMAIIVWFNLPTSLVLPLLFLQRTGRFLHCRK